MEKRYADDKSTSEFRRISPARCQELLESQIVGRIAWQAADGPQILPVTYAWHQGMIIFRTSPYGVLSELIGRPRPRSRSTSLIKSVVEGGAWWCGAGRRESPNLINSFGCGPWAALFRGRPG